MILENKKYISFNETYKDDNAVFYMKVKYRVSGESENYYYISQGENCSKIEKSLEGITYKTGGIINWT